MHTKEEEANKADEEKLKKIKVAEEEEKKELKGGQLSGWRAKAK